MAQIPVFTVCNVGSNKIQIKDNSQDNDFYLPEDVNDTFNLNTRYELKQFKYSQTYTVNHVQYTSTKGVTQLSTIYTDHSVYLDEAYYEIPQDGYYTIFHFIIPNIEWLQEIVDRKLNFIKETSLVLYVTDGNTIYSVNKQKLINAVFSETVQEDTINVMDYVSEIESLETLISSNVTDTTILLAKKDTFSINRLYDCYISISKDMFNTANIKCLDKNDKDLIFKRDFLWMTINVLKYRVENSQLFEAQRILETVNGCGSFCKTSKPNLNISGCGCYK